MGFPSPAGVFFISSRKRRKLTPFEVELFPSPAGVFFISSYFKEKNMVKFENLVSVPCRGLFYFIHYDNTKNNKQNKSFRPLPGSFLFHQTQAQIFDYLSEVFPSPAGVFFISSLVKPFHVGK